MRDQTTYGKLVGRVENEYYYLEYVFQDDTFKGAVGAILIPVSFAEMEERRTIFDDDGELWRAAVEAQQTELSHKDWRDRVLAIDGDDAVIDLSWFCDYGEALLERLDPKHEVYEYTEGIGGGRCFHLDMVWDELYAPDLWEIIKQYETS